MESDSIGEIFHNTMGYFSTLHDKLPSSRAGKLAYRKGFHGGIKVAHCYAVNNVLLCTHNPILIKNFYGILRDGGLNVEIADHTALAVQMVFEGKYAAVIIDSDSLGLSAEEAVQIMRSISPDMPIMVAGNDTYTGGVLSVKTPVDLEEFKETVHALIGSAKYMRTKEEQKCL